MDFEVYCDESNPDVFNSLLPIKNHNYLCIAGIWLPAILRVEIKESINKLKKKHNCLGELKWSKVSLSKSAFYFELIDLFISYGQSARFRAIVVPSNEVKWKLHNNDQELGFYKFYYQLIHHWILDFNRYFIFCDTKTNRNKDRLKVLQHYLQKANISSQVENVQSLPSSDVSLIQFTDFFLGMVNARFNNTIQPNSVKNQLIRHLEQRLGVVKLCPTPRSEQKFNIFKIDLSGGW